MQNTRPLCSTVTLDLPIFESYHHPLGAVHGSVTFKALDDAAFFAANSLIEDVFVLTTNFNLHFERPVSEGTIHAEGEVVNDILCREESGAHTTYRPDYRP